MIMHITTGIMVMYVDRHITIIVICLMVVLLCVLIAITSPYEIYRYNIISLISLSMLAITAMVVLI
jgi:hypothetical protein